MKHLCAVGVSLTLLASVAWADNARSCYTGQVGFSIGDPSDRLMCGDGSGGEMKSESCSTGICGQYEYEDEQCVYMVGFCSHATTVIECEDSIRLEREDEDAPATMLARRLRSQQSGQVMRRVACCESTDCNAKALSPKSTRKLFADRSNRKLLARRLKKKSGYKYKSKSYKYKKSYKSSKYSSGGVYYSGGSYGGSIAGGVVSFIVVVVIIVIIICLRRKTAHSGAAAVIVASNPQHIVQPDQATLTQTQTAVKVQAMYRGHKARVQYAQRMNNPELVQAQPIVVSGTPVQTQAVVAGVQPATTAGVQPAVAQPFVVQPTAVVQSTAVAQPVVGVQPTAVVQSTAVAQPAAVQPVVVQPTL